MRRQTRCLIGLIMPWVCDIGTDRIEISYEVETDTSSEESEESEDSVGHLGVHVQNSLPAPFNIIMGGMGLHSSYVLPAMADSQHTTQHMGSQTADSQRYVQPQAGCWRELKFDHELDSKRADFQDHLGIGTSCSVKRRRING